MLARLVDNSLVDAAQEEQPRYRLLETIRTFLLDDLDARGERTEAETRFLRCRASQTAVEISAAVRGEAEAAADRRLRAELANLRAARDLSRGRGDVELRIDLTVALDDAATLARPDRALGVGRRARDDPLLRGNPRENAVRASAAEASWLLGDLVGAARLARAAIDAAGDDARCVSAWSASAAVALFRGDHARAAQDWAAAAARSPLPSPYLASGALALGSPVTRPERTRCWVTPPVLWTLGRARRTAPGSGTSPVSWRPPRATPVPRSTATPRRSTLARGCGAGFIEGVAAVGLAACIERPWVTCDAAAEDYVWLLRYWSAAGNLTQLWTTARDAAALLDAHGASRAAVLLLLAAGSADAASALVGDAALRADDILGRLGADETASAQRPGSVDDSRRGRRVRRRRLRSALRGASVP